MELGLEWRRGGCCLCGTWGVCQVRTPTSGGAPGAVGGDSSLAERPELLLRPLPSTLRGAAQRVGPPLLLQPRAMPPAVPSPSPKGKPRFAFC